MKRERLSGWLGSILLIVAILPAGCGSEPDPGPDVTGPATGSTTTPTPTPDGQPPSVDPATTTGFPCDVRAVLQRHCASCHAGRLYYGPNFESRDDLLVAATDAFLAPRTGVLPGTLGEHVATALGDQSMPPYGAVTRPTPAERQLVIAWVGAGMPAGDCGVLTPPP